MRIVVTGGGSGGHVIPILAVADKLKIIAPRSKITFIRQIGDKHTQDMISRDKSGSIDKTKAISAGKFRRYHDVPAWKQITDIPMQLKNVRDLFFFWIGLIQSTIYLAFHRPDVVFVKGGYVGLPVGLAASWLNIPLVVHESDSVMGLTNRILSKRACRVGLGVPVEYSSIRKNTTFVGVPVSSKFKKVSGKMQNDFKQELGYHPDDMFILVTGGSQGAERINASVAAISSKLSSLAYVVHQTGDETYEQITEQVSADDDDGKQKYRTVRFIENDMHKYVGAADIIITRVGMTTMSELAISAKPLIIIANPKLVHGHQLANARIYSEKEAAIALDESEMNENPQILYETVNELIKSEETRKKLSENIHKLAKSSAADDIAKLILDCAKK